MTGEIILNDLAHLPVWVGWREEHRGGDATKVPFNPRTGKEAKSTDPTTWSTRGEAETWAATDRGGVGIVLSQLNGNDCFLAGIDLDTCRDPNTENFQDWAQEVIDRFETYTEVSPSGTGAKLFFTHASSDLPAIEKLFDGQGGRQFKNGGGKHCPAIEVYRTGRYFTVTDESIGPTDILRQVPLADLEWLIREAGPKFAHKESQKSSSGNDQSRSGKAFRKGAALKAAGHSYTAMRDALLADADPEIAEWARTKGLANGERELHRIYHKQAGNGEAPPKHFELIPFDQIIFDDAEEWLVKGLLPRQGVGAFFGAKSAFKSFAAQDVGMHVACGWNWAGRRVMQAPVVYIAAEGAGGFRKRKAGFELQHAEHLPETVPFHLIAAAPNLGQGTADLEALAADVKASGVSPGLIVIDTLAQTLGSGEENGAGMVQLIANATALSQQFSCFVLLVHHAGLTETERLRGHSSLGCALDALVFFEPKEGALAARLTVQKLKEEADRNVTLDMELLRVVIAKDCDGDEISTLVVDTVRDGDATRPAPKKPASQAKMVCDEFVTVYDFLADGKPQLVGLDGRSRVLKVPVKEIREELRNRGFLDCDEKGNLERVSRNHFSRAKNDLLRRGIFIERGGQIWRKGVANLYEKTDA